MQAYTCSYTSCYLFYRRIQIKETLLCKGKISVQVQNRFNNKYVLLDDLQVSIFTVVHTLQISIFYERLNGYCTLNLPTVNISVHAKKLFFDTGSKFDQVILLDYNKLTL